MNERMKMVRQNDAGKMAHPYYRRLACKCQFTMVRTATGETPVVRKTALRKTGFTLIELLVVIGIILMIAAMSFPSMARLYARAADDQTYNLVAGLLTVARAEAMRNDNYYTVHFQKYDGYMDINDNFVRDANEPLAFPELDGRSAGFLMVWKKQSITMAWNAEGAVPKYDNLILEGCEDISPVAPATCNERTYLDGTNGVLYSMRFIGAPGHAPKTLPGSMAVGEASDRFVSDVAGEFQFNDAELADAPTANTGGIDDFLTANLTFSPQGKLVEKLRPNSETLNGSENLYVTADVNVRFSTNGRDPDSIPAGTGVAERDYSGIFYGANSIDSNSYIKPIWDVDRSTLDKSNGEPGAAALTIIDAAKLRACTDANRAEYLENDALILGVNRFSGLVFPRD